MEEFAGSVGAHIEEKARWVPRRVFADAIKYGRYLPDPLKQAGKIKILYRFWKNNKARDLEVIYNVAKKEITHFVYPDVK